MSAKKGSSSQRRPQSALKRFKRAGWSHLRSAEHLLAIPAPARGVQPALMPASAAYLGHVALECAMKAHLLYRGGCDSIDALLTKHPKVYDALFNSSKGHDLGRLAADVRLPELMKHQGLGYRDDDCWKRIASRERPYSLRYGAEELTGVEVRQECTRASEILKVLLSGIDRVHSSKQQRGAR